LFTDTFFDVKPTQKYDVRSLTEFCLQLALQPSHESTEADWPQRAQGIFSASIPPMIVVAIAISHEIRAVPNNKEGPTKMPVWFSALNT